MDWEDRARSLLGQEFAPVKACDPVNAPMIRHWCEAMGMPISWDRNAAAPATMLQPWLFPGPTRQRPPGSADQDATTVHGLFAEGGYSGVVTVGAELTFDRPLSPGDELSYTSALESIGEEKQTGLGRGRFLGFRQTVRDADGECVGTIRFTNLVYQPAAGVAS
jgi:uncharacterized protein